MRWIGFILGLALLCQCATQHETKEFAPFFRTDPVGYFNSSYVYERGELESRSDLSLWERKRLRDLYELEIRQVSKDSARWSALAASLEKLTQVTQPLTDRLDAWKRSLAEKNEIAKSDASPVFNNEEYKKEYYQAYRLWNRDENEAALEKALLLAKDPRFAELGKKERFKVLNLQFRVALDLQNTSVAEGAYRLMQVLDSCAAETAEAGFLIALTHLGAGEGPRAKEIFENQCDPDETPSNLVRRHYWSARLKEAVGRSASEEYLQIADSAVPGYYYYLAHARMGEPLSFSNIDACSYRAKTIQMPTAVSELLVQAEQSLAANLRNDAAVFLQAAAQKLKIQAKKESVPSLLYTAYLFQAAGLQLEALKIYAVVTELGHAHPSDVTFDFLTEMFPSPHRGYVKALSKEWKVDGDFLYAIMRQESAFNPGAVSSANARGLMQLMPFLAAQIARQWGYDSYFSNRSLFFAKENMKLATYHLQQVQAVLPHPALIAAAYNAGAKRVVQWWKRGPGLPLDIFVELIPIVETRNYVKLVLRNYVFYKLVHSGGKLDAGVVPFRLPESSPLAVERL